MFIISIFIPITQQPEQDRLAENQPTAGLSSLNENEYGNENENGMGKSETELHRHFQQTLRGEALLGKFPNLSGEPENSFRFCPESGE